MFSCIYCIFKMQYDLCLESGCAVVLMDTVVESLLLTRFILLALRMILFV